MRNYSLSHLSDPVLLRDLGVLVARDRATTAELLAHLAEVDERKLYLPAAHPSMHAYCVQELGFSEQIAYKRIRAARVAHRFPTIFSAVADGRLNLGAVILLAPHLTPENADELVTGAAHQTESEIEKLLARRFPRPDLPTRVRDLSPPTLGEGQLSARTVESSAPARMELPRPKVAPLSPERYALQLTIGQGAHDKLRYAQELLGHQIPAGEIGEVFERALDALIDRLEKRKFAATGRPRPGSPRASANPRHIPAEVKRAVWQRDQGQCTFTSERGRRCPARSRLEFDHIDPFARGGEATVGGIRLRCRAHNQYAAECTFGAGFMERKRALARSEQVAARTQPAAPVAAARVEPAPESDVVPWLRQLGFSVAEARRAASACEHIPDASLDQRLRLALSHLAPPHRVVRPSVATH